MQGRKVISAVPPYLATNKKFLENANSRLLSHFFEAPECLSLKFPALTIPARSCLSGTVLHPRLSIELG